MDAKTIITVSVISGLALAAAVSTDFQFLTPDPNVTVDWISYQGDHVNYVDLDVKNDGYSGNVTVEIIFQDEEGYIIDSEMKEFSLDRRERKTVNVDIDREIEYDDMRIRGHSSVFGRFYDYYWILSDRISFL